MKRLTTVRRLTLLVLYAAVMGPVADAFINIVFLPR